MLTAGALIAGKYRVIKKLGEGAMGSVWLAKNEVTDREFAIKVLLPEAAEAPSALARFLREARVCGALRHPSILEIYDAGAAPEIGGAPFLVMERLDGAPLDVVLRLRGALPARLALDIVAQISRGLELAHAKGIIHRDLKPANVFLHRPGSGAIEPKVLDFGISKVVGPKSPEVALTNTAAILGSPIYMSPEQMSSEAGLDARSDVHALGVLLWELLTGSAPFASTSYNLLVVEIMRGPRPLLRDAMPAASKELAAVLDRAFAIDRADRFASAAALADAIDLELSALGGGILGGRTAAGDVLGGLDLSSNAPPPLHSTTTEPFSIDPSSLVSPSARSVERSGKPRASATSFADTQVAAAAASEAGPRVPPAAAVSGAHARESAPAKKGSLSLRVGFGLTLAAAAAVTLSFTLRRGDGRANVRAEPPPSVAGATAAAPAGSVSPITPSPVAPASASPAAAGSISGVPAPSASGSAGASARPASPAPGPRRSPRPPVPTGAPSTAPTAHPRIDQSGL